MTIEQLAASAGMTVRNIRAHQTRGLLPPPRLVGRTGFYGAEHLARLELIRRMQAGGFNLGSIRALLASVPEGGGEELLAFERAVTAPWTGEAPEEFTVSQLGAMFGWEDMRHLDAAVRLGLLVPVDKDRFHCPAPSLLRAGGEISKMGIGPEPMLRVLETLMTNAKGIAQCFVDLFVEQVWRPFDAAGRPAGQWPTVRASLERLRSMAHRAVVASFGAAMGSAVEEAFGREIDSLEPLHRAN